MQAVFADALEQFLAGDVAEFVFLRRLARYLVRVIERLTQEKIGFPVVTEVLGGNLFDGFLETRGLHIISNSPVRLTWLRDVPSATP